MVERKQTSWLTSLANRLRSKLQDRDMQRVFLVPFHEFVSDTKQGNTSASATLSAAVGDWLESRSHTSARCLAEDDWTIAETCSPAMASSTASSESSPAATATSCKRWVVIVRPPDAHPVRQHDAAQQLPRESDEAEEAQRTPHGLATQFIEHHVSAHPTPCTVLLAGSRQPDLAKRNGLAIATRQFLTTLPPRTHVVTAEGLTYRDMSVHVAEALGRHCWEWCVLPELSKTRGHADSTRNSAEQISRFLRRHRHYVGWLTPQLIDTEAEPLDSMVRPWPNARSINHDPALAQDQPSPLRHWATEPSIPLRDQLAFASASQVRLLTIRRGGHTWKLIQNRLSINKACLNLTPEPKTAKQVPSHVHVFVPQLKPESDGNRSAKQIRDTCHELMSLGSIGWYVLDPTEEASPTTTDRHWAPNLNSVGQLQPGDADGFLSHHTRGFPGKLAGEADYEYWWQWLIGHRTHHSPLDTLLRIICQKRIKSCGKLIPGQEPVVCLSARGPRESWNASRFRPHLRRWDFEPYGIAIATTWLERMGAQPVEYVDARTASHTYAQLRYSQGESGERIDWSEEREFRVRGDIDLTRVPLDSIFYFVATKDEAEWIAQFTAAPVKYMTPSERCGAGKT